MKFCQCLILRAKKKVLQILFQKTQIQREQKLKAFATLGTKRTFCFLPPEEKKTNLFFGTFSDDCFGRHKKKRKEPTFPALSVQFLRTCLYWRRKKVLTFFFLAKQKTFRVNLPAFFKTKQTKNKLFSGTPEKGSQKFFFLLPSLPFFFQPVFCLLFFADATHCRSSSLIQTRKLWCFRTKKREVFQVGF